MLFIIDLMIPHNGMNSININYKTDLTKMYYGGGHIIPFWY